MAVQRKEAKAIGEQRRTRPIGVDGSGGESPVQALGRITPPIDEIRDRGQAGDVSRSIAYQVADRD